MKANLVKESLITEKLTWRDITNGNGPKYVVLYNDDGEYKLHSYGETAKELADVLNRAINPK